MKRLSNAVLFVAVLALALPSWAGLQKPGKWEITAQMEMAGMPSKMPPHPMTHCVTKEDADNPESVVPKSSRAKDSNCKVSDFKIDGNKVTWSMKCEGEHAATSHGELTFSEDSFAGWSKMKMSAEGQEHEMTVKYTGKWLGPCDK
jgi:Protein of unknown function (DUF3617)